MADRWPGSRFVGEASLKGDLYELGDYPGLDLGGPGEVVGEVYEISDEVLKQLDHFENTADYGRSQVAVSLQGRPTTCWVYQPNSDRSGGARRIDSGDWIEYLRSRKESG